MCCRVPLFCSPTMATVCKTSQKWSPLTSTNDQHPQQHQAKLKADITENHMKSRFCYCGFSWLMLANNSFLANMDKLLASLHKYCFELMSSTSSTLLGLIWLLIWLASHLQTALLSYEATNHRSMQNSYS